MSIAARSRMISFRLSAEDYQKCLELCSSQNLRTVSEMARTAISLLLKQPAIAPRESLEWRLAELEHRYQMLTVEIRRLSTSGVAARSTRPAPPERTGPAQSEGTV
jgi:hypothetical protein